MKCSNNQLAKPDMCAHKLCALLDRTEITGRDIFDCWFSLNSHTPVNAAIVESRMEMPLQDYLQRCIETVEQVSDKTIMNGLGELTDGETKKFAKTKLRKETVSLLMFFRAFPVAL